MKNFVKALSISFSLFLIASFAIQPQANAATGGGSDDEYWNTIDEECCENGDWICAVVTPDDPNT